MSIKKNIKNQVSKIQELVETTPDLDSRLDDLIKLLEKSDLDSETAAIFKLKLDNALENAISSKAKIEAFKELDSKDDLSRERMLDNISLLLERHDIDSKQAKSYLWHESVKRVVVSMISIVLICLGFAMIIMPAPPYFEMFTIFYFNPNDGVTLMDLISLLIVLSGVYLLIKSIFLKQNPEY
ncbi:MAG: hypothetical protein JWN56_734 [Sphingobacteriales bacterium]|nr:hypothetical protein [Sphingobacteriales bacterium]